MRFAIIGYGKMGKTIEALALERGHTISAIIDTHTDRSLSDVSQETTDVAIEFTNPEVAFQNLSHLAHHQVPTISGTTGWLSKYEELCTLVGENDSALLYASNFSIGVNIFFDINRRLAKLMGTHPSYKVSMEEIHHIHKLDAPSGTAITLAADIQLQQAHIEGWVNEESSDNKTIGIVSKRIGEVPGTHSIDYASDIDKISISHEAFSRQGFALGAVIAAEWIHGKKGIFSMKDVLDI